jgi:CHAT domain-containing protein
LPGQQSGTYLIEERAIAVIPVPQALPELIAKGDGDARHPGALSKGARETNPESLLLVGDVDYGGDPGVMLASDRGGRAVRDGQMVWDPLPGTRTEISTIRDSFERRFTEGKVQQLHEQQATVAAVRSAVPNYRYLHFATHGFFADPSVRSLLVPTEKPELSLFRDELHRPVSGEHPGLLSGIVLTGANRPPAEGKDDGILTALEVGELDLHGVELVTLSACETGLGATAGGEGLLGLQRAFQTAGARTTVATLWMVRDDAAQRLMTQMYENIWTKRMSKLEALRQAQLSILHNGFQIAGERPDQSTRGGVKLLDPPVNEQRRLPPYYWAAFVLSGDWR